jgi:hypothetical protein
MIGGVLERLDRGVRRAVIVFGFVSSLTGTLGSFLLIESLGDDLKALVDRKSAAAREIEKLGALTGNYFIANQQGDLIYLLGAQEGARQEVARLIYQGNLLDRAEPVRNVIAALALSGLIDYRKTYAAYETLNDAARQSHALTDFVAVKAYERQVVEQAQKRVAHLQLGQAPLQQQISATEAHLATRRQLLIAFSSFGAFLLLVANLLEQQKKAREAAASAAT